LLFSVKNISKYNDNKMHFYSGKKKDLLGKFF